MVVFRAKSSKPTHNTTYSFDTGLITQFHKDWLVLLHITGGFGKMAG